MRHNKSRMLAIISHLWATKGIVKECITNKLSRKKIKRNNICTGPINNKYSINGLCYY